MAEKIDELTLSNPIASRVYSNQGNAPLLGLIRNGCVRVLDVGCGAGDNAAVLQRQYPQCEVFGITQSPAEAELAKTRMRRCWVADIEDKLPEEITNQSYDTIIFSHVLEHLRFPAAVVAKFARLLSRSGQVLIAVPNVLSWRIRLRFLFGDFQYDSAGVLDDTHLRFYTYVTADKYLLSDAPDLTLSHKLADGNVPLWVLRRHFLTDHLRRQLDEYGCRTWPNLFGWQVLIRAEKK